MWYFDFRFLVDMHDEEKETFLVGLHQAWDEHKCVVIDMTIVADNFPTNDAHELKRIYYDKPAIREWCGQRSGRPPEEIHFTACAINWRGTPATRSTTELLDLCGISRNDFLLMSVRTLEQGVKINATFH